MRDMGGPNGTGTCYDVSPGILASFQLAVEQACSRHQSDCLTLGWLSRLCVDALNRFNVNKQLFLEEQVSEESQ